MSESLRKVLKTAVVGLGIAVGSSEAGSQTERPSGLEYSARNVIVRFSPFARKVHEEFGYSFPVIDGVMNMCLHGKSCLKFELGPGIKSVIFDIRDVDTPGGKKILMCISKTLSDNREKPNFQLVDPKTLLTVPAPDELAKQCFPELTS